MPLSRPHYWHACAWPDPRAATANDKNRHSRACPPPGYAVDLYPRTLRILPSLGDAAARGCGRGGHCHQASQPDPDRRLASRHARHAWQASHADAMSPGEEATPAKVLEQPDDILTDASVLFHARCQRRGGAKAGRRGAEVPFYFPAARGPPEGLREDLRWRRPFCPGARGYMPAAREEPDLRG